MVEEIVLKGEPFDEQKKKWLKKYSEAEGLNYVELEGNLSDFISYVPGFYTTDLKTLQLNLEVSAKKCYIRTDLIKHLLQLAENQFDTIKIGKQILMARNLDVNQFRSGEPIKEAKTTKEWNDAVVNSQPAWCYYNNDPTNNAKYGKLYNWYAVIDTRNIAPNGWHIPDFKEWKEAEQNRIKSNANYLPIDIRLRKAEKRAAGVAMLGSVFTETELNNRIVNAGGYRFNGKFSSIQQFSYWWCASNLNSISEYIHFISMLLSSPYYTNISIAQLYNFGFSIRCFKD